MRLPSFIDCDASEKVEMISRVEQAHNQLQEGNNVQNSETFEDNCDILVLNIILLSESPYFVGRYLENGPEIRQLLVRLVDAGKKLFLVTNSAFPFV